MRKLEDGVADATILANAGLRRLGLEHEITELLDLARFPPAPGQGAICIESRIGDTRTDALLAALDDQATRQQLDCERAFLGLLDGSCRTPIAGHAVIDGDHIRFSGLVLTPDGTIWHDIVETGARSDASLIGKRAAARIRDKAGALFFDSWV
jgi:hydroxymethylbilane synthase